MDYKTVTVLGLTSSGIYSFLSFTSGNNSTFCFDNYFYFTHINSLFSTLILARMKCRINYSYFELYYGNGKSTLHVQIRKTNKFKLQQSSTFFSSFVSQSVYIVPQIGISEHYIPKL